MKINILILTTIVAILFSSSVVALASKKGKEAATVQVAHPTKTPEVLELRGKVDSYIVMWIQEYLNGTMDMATLQSLVNNHKVVTNERSQRYYLTKGK
jgi:hypothetical protein